VVLPDTQALEEVAAGAGSGDAGTVLVIDDDPTMHDLLQRALSREGFRVEAALEGEGGLERAREIKPDIILLDVLMPGLDGWSVLSILKSDRELSSIPVVIVSMLEDRRLAFALGAAEYVTKPVEPGRLANLLQRLAPEPNARIMFVEDGDGMGDLAQELRGIIQPEAPEGAPGPGGLT
jgi:CheY-like chemotaxis protein